MALILVFVLEIIISFNSKLGSIVGVSDRENCMNQVVVPPGVDTAGIKLPSPEELCASVDVFQMGNVSTLQTTIILAVAILTIANALAPKFSEGGNNLKIISFFAVTCLTSAVVMFVVPKVTAALLSTPENGSSGLVMGMYKVISAGVI